MEKGKREREGERRRSHDKVYDGARADSGGAVRLETFSNEKNLLVIFCFIFLRRRKNWENVTASWL